MACIISCLFLVMDVSWHCNIGEWQLEINDKINKRFNYLAWFRCGQLMVCIISCLILVMDVSWHCNIGEWQLEINDKINKRLITLHGSGVAS